MAVATLSTRTRREIESFVTDWLADNGIPGASVALVERNEVTYAEGFGSRDLDANAPATADTSTGSAPVRNRSRR